MGAARPLAALLSPAGRGALAVVGVVGPAALPVVARLFTPRRPEIPLGDPASGLPPAPTAPPDAGDASPATARAGEPPAAIRFGRWAAPGAGAGEDVVVVAVGRDRLEVHCHGGFAAPEAILESLVAAGAERVSWQRWLAGAGEAEWAIEVREALAATGGPRAARILARQLGGAWDAEWRRLEDLYAVDPAGLEARVARLLAASRVGMRLVRPWRVVLMGPVNAGKSSLVNALAGHARCIVTPLPGTTRDLVETRIVLGGWEVDLVDTAGLRESGDPVGAVEGAGIDRAVAAAAAADLVVHLFPADGVRAKGPDMFGPLPAHHLPVLSRCDLAGAARAGEPDPARGLVATSAVTGQGIDGLVEEIVARLVPEERSDPGMFAAAVPVTAGQVAALRSLLDRT